MHCSVISRSSVEFKLKVSRFIKLAMKDILAIENDADDSVMYPDFAFLLIVIDHV